MIRRIGIVLLLLCLLAQGAAAVSEAVLRRAIDIIGKEESSHNYGCVVVDTNGKLSVGFMQWNAGRASKLVQKIQERRGLTFEGSLSNGDKAWVKEALLTPEGRGVQDEQARLDVSGYIAKAMSLGIKDPNALCYYADIVHQVGTGAITKYHELAAKKAGGYGKVTLEHLYQAALNYATYTKARRQRVYRQLKENPVGGAAQPDPQPTPSPETGLSIVPGGPHTLYLGETLQLKAEGAEQVRWSSSKGKIARVNQRGLVKPVKPGKAFVRAKSAAGAIAKVQILVKKPPLRALSLSGPRTMRPRTVKKIVPAFTPAAARCPLRWTSSDKKVLLVNRKGWVRALRPGTAVISCTARGGMSARITVQVA